MASETLEARVQKLEDTVQVLQNQLTLQSTATNAKRGWRWFVGIYADSPDFEDVVRIGEEWRNSDRPTDDEVGE